MKRALGRETRQEGGTGGGCDGAVGCVEGPSPPERGGASFGLMTAQAQVADLDESPYLGLEDSVTLSPTRALAQSFVQLGVCKSPSRQCRLQGALGATAWGGERTREGGSPDQLPAGPRERSPTGP